MDDVCLDNFLYIYWKSPQNLSVIRFERKNMESTVGRARPWHLEERKKLSPKSSVRYN